MPELKLGKKPARVGAYQFKLLSFLTQAPPVAPAVFGHTDLITDYGMLGNDQYGDCVWAGAAHETMLWSAESGKKTSFSTQSVLQDYSAVTGFNPSDANSDQGTDMEAAAKYRRKTGVADSVSTRHKVDAYLELPGVSAQGANTSALLPAIAWSAYVFGAVGIGIEFPDTAMAQFNASQPWTVVKGASIEGGHYVPLVGRRANGNYVVITWGQLQEVTPEFLKKYVDEAVVYVSIEQLKDGKTLEGFDVASLQANLAALGGTTPFPTPAPSPTPSPTPSPSPTPTPKPVVDSNVQVLDTWAAAAHVGSNAKAAKAWKAFKASLNL